MKSMLLERIKRLGYTGELLDPDKLSEAIKLGPKSTEYTKLVSWMADELKILNDMEETIHPITSLDDTSSFLLELNCFLKELDCINERFSTGSVNERLATEEDRCYLIELLASEVRTCRLLELKNLEGEPSMEVNIHESDGAKDLKEMLITLHFEKPPDNISPEMLFTRLESKLTNVLKAAPPDILNKPLITEELSKNQWEELTQLQQHLHLEYTMRRDMLLKRLDVTIQSFFWADAIKSREAELSAKYEEARKQLNAEPQVTVADLLAARSDIAVIEKMSNATVRKNTRSKINSIIIGDVPDRGGRPYEQEPPPPEMPSWQKDRVPGPPGFGGGRGGGRGGGGGGGGFRGRGRGGAFGGESSGFQGANTSSSSYGGGGGGGPSGGKPGGYGGFGGKGEGFSMQQGGGYGGAQRGGYSGAQGGGFGGFAATQGSGFPGTQGGGFADAQGSGGLGGSGGGGNGSGVKSGGGFRDCKDTMNYNCKNIDYHQPQYSGYGHRYCYPNNAASEGSKDDQQYQRSGGYNRGRGGKVQGGWNQGGNNRGSDNYQQGGYNRSSDNYQQGGYNRGSDNYEQGGYNRGSGGYKGAGQNRGSDNYQQGGSSHGSDNYQRGGYNRGSDNSQRGHNRRRGMGERHY